MGVTQPEGKASSPDAPADATDAPRDADCMPMNQWLRRSMPKGDTGRTAGFQVLFASGVIEDIRAHGLSSPEAEVCGVLVGNVYCDGHGPWCRVAANIRGNGAAGRNAQVTFTGETWAHINHLMDTQFREDRIVGWYHTHPGFGIFLSEMDLFIQENFFGEPWQIAYVDDPKGGDRGAFVWENGAAVRRAHLTEPPPAAEQTSDQAQSAARAPFDGREKRIRRGKLLRRNAGAIALAAVLTFSGLLYSGVIPRQRVMNLAPVRWVAEKITGHPRFSR